MGYEEIKEFFKVVRVRYGELQLLEQSLQVFLSRLLAVETQLIRENLGFCP